jgi:hypothetical protein
MATDSEFKKKLQIFTAAAIVLAGSRAAYILYERHEAMTQEVAAPRDVRLKADYYVAPRKLHPYDLRSAHQLTAQPVWVRLGYQLTYYPYDREDRRTDFRHEVGTLPPLLKLTIQDVVIATPPQDPGTKQVMACFSLAGKGYAVPIGAEKGGDFRIYSDNMFFIDDPHVLYKHWPADIWSKIDAHEVLPGMSELQTSFAVGVGVPEGSGDYGSRTLRYANGGKPLQVRFEDDKAVDIKTGSPVGD